MPAWYRRSPRPSSRRWRPASGATSPTGTGRRSGRRTVAVLIGPRRIREDDVVEVSRHAGPPIHLSDSASAPTRPAQGRGYTTLGTPAAASAGPAGPEVLDSPGSYGRLRSERSPGQPPPRPRRR